MKNFLKDFVKYLLGLVVLKSIVSLSDSSELMVRSSRSLSMTMLSKNVLEDLL